MVFVDNQVSVVLCTSAAAVCEVLSPVMALLSSYLFLCWVISCAFHLFFAILTKEMLTF